MWQVGRHMGSVRACVRACGWGHRTRPQPTKKDGAPWGSAPALLCLQDWQLSGQSDICTITWEVAEAGTKCILDTLSKLPEEGSPMRHPLGSNGSQARAEWSNGAQDADLDRPQLACLHEEEAAAESHWLLQCI